MHYGEIKKSDVANGEGIRVTLFVSGCRNRCKNCFNPDTWAFDYGREFDTAAKDIIFRALDNPVLRGLTVLGGEPMEPENQRELLPFLREVKEKYPTKTIWLYTGNLYEELIGIMGEHPKHLDITEELLSYVDILVDGPFIEERARLGLRFRGSDNQRIIDMNKTRKSGNIEIWGGTQKDRTFGGQNDSKN